MSKNLFREGICEHFRSKPRFSVFSCVPPQAFGARHKVQTRHRPRRRARARLLRRYLTSRSRPRRLRAPAATALPTPAITGPLQGQPPFLFDAGPFGKIAVNGLLSGSGLWQDNHVPGDNTKQADLSNGQIFIQKTDGWFQFYLQAGAYNIPDLGAPFLSTNKTMSNFCGPLPLAFVKLQAGKNTSFQIGALPTLIGAEYTFSFENMNVERGLLWNQENAVNRGIQVNQTMGKFTASLSWNDGFYSNRYTWLSGSLAYTNGPHALSFVAGGNLGQTKYQTFATPVQNNGSIYNVIYTYTKGPWIVQPYFQYTDVPTNAKIGIVKGASTKGGAILVSHAFKHGFSLAGRCEYISSSGSVANQAVNLIFGPGSARHVSHGDANVSVRGLLRSWRPFQCLGDQVHARFRLRFYGLELKPGTSHGGDRLYLWQQHHREKTVASTYNRFSRYWVRASRKTADSIRFGAPAILRRADSWMSRS